MCHITGGGIIENIPRIIPNGLGIDFNNHNWKLPNIYNWFRKQGDLSFKEMLKIFNCGVGMILICKKNKAKNIISQLNKNKEPFFYLGNIIKSKKKIDFKLLEQKWKI